ncbi:MAG: DUF4280 domain-containing protein [Bacteroidales bacterium]|nr:DUF4280 domain-containing protein [Bacteroidales bacterium]
MEYVCTGATLKCTMGTSCPKLKATPKNVSLTGKDQANIADYVSMKNVPSFGRCRSLGYPPTASATAANHGKLTPMPCVPGTCPKWKAIDKDSLICGEPALLKPATLKCMYGGTISIVDPGQTLEIKSSETKQLNINETNANKKKQIIIKTDYSKNSDLDNLFKSINSNLGEEKWFEHGDMKISITDKDDVNGFTYMDGRISLSRDRLDNVKIAIKKIGEEKSETITFSEADAMATLWHEITHNRNKPGNMKLTEEQVKVMEMMNEFVARKTLPEFYSQLGCDTMPYPEFINNRDSTGYNRRVLAYEFVIEKFNLNKNKVYESAKKNLFNLKYTEQETTAMQALIDGGLANYKSVNGNTINKERLKNIIKLCSMGVDKITIENYMKKEGLIP